MTVGPWVVRPHVQVNCQGITRQSRIDFNEVFDESAFWRLRHDWHYELAQLGHREIRAAFDIHQDRGSVAQGQAHPGCGRAFRRRRLLLCNPAQIVISEIDFLFRMCAAGLAPPEECGTKVLKVEADASSVGLAEEFCEDVGAVDQIASLP